MNDTTRHALLLAARRLFALHGYDGASVRAITRAAGANLGAITYHFGSKEALYETVLGQVQVDLDRQLFAAADSPGSPLQRIEGMVRAFFQFFAERPEVPQLVMHELARARPLPEPVRHALQKRIAALSGLIREGQEDGSIRSGDPTLLALSVVSQPLWIAVAARPVQEGAKIDPENPETRARLVDSVVAFVRSGLRSQPESQA